MNETFLGSSSLILLTTFLLYNKAFNKEGLPTCNNYIQNTYSYLLLSLLLVTATISGIDQFNIKVKYNLIYYILLFGLLLLVIKSDPRNVAMKHLWYLTYILLFSLIVYPIYKLSEHRNIFKQTVIYTILIFGILTAYTYKNPNFVKNSWGSSLANILLFGIIVSLINIFVLNTPIKQSMMSIGFVVLFCFFILYDTKNIMVRAQNCIENRNVPDYINESMNIFLDVINLFSDLTMIQGNE
jgi:FtsH-binding integral membrane protein